MVRGLIIRQTFLILDLVLVGAILLSAGMVVTQMFSRPKSVVAEVVAEDGSGGAVESLLANLRARKDYDSILTSGLFGDAGRFNPDKVEEVVAVVDTGIEEPEETQLQLTLVGTTSLSPTSIFASATIQNKATRDEGQLYSIGETIVNDVTLMEVHPRWVLLKNNQKPPAKLEKLSMDDQKEEPNSGMASRTSASRRPVPQRTNIVQLDRVELVQELQNVNVVELLAQVKPREYTDSSGRVAGMTADGDISNIPLAKKLGLQNNDVLQTVNNEKIESTEKLYELVNKNQGASSFEIGILRGGRVQKLTYQLR